MHLRRLMLLALTLLALFLAVAAAPRLSAADAAEARLPTFYARATITGPYTFDEPSPAVYDPVKRRMYFTYGPYGYERSLITIDVPTGGVVVTRNRNFSHAVAVSPDGSRLYATTTALASTGYNQRVLIFDTTDVSAVGEFTFDCALPKNCTVMGLAVGPAGRLYVVPYGDNHLDVRNPATGALLHRLTLDADMDGLDGMALYGNDLFVVESPTNGDGVNNPDREIHRYDISGVVPVLELSVPLPGREGGWWYMSAGGRYLVGGNVLFSPDTLQAVRTLDYANAKISYDEEHFVRTEDGPYLYMMQLREYDIAAQKLQREVIIYYEYTHVPFKQLLPLPNGEVAVIFDDAVRIYSPADYATLLPVAFANYCAAPFLDDFSDPNSGWPIGDTGRTLFRYDNAEYSIFHREKERWSAVSRGDYWDDTWRVAGVTTWLPAKSGTSGIVFGLNADWSYFYTFEVIPDEQRWAFFRYSNGRWELLNTGTHGSIKPIGERNDLTLRIYNGQVDLEVDRQRLMTIPAIPPGRIGLSAGSFEPDVDARFDDYYFAGPNCPLPGLVAARGRLDVAPPITRPPLETFLP